MLGVKYRRIEFLLTFVYLKNKENNFSQNFSDFSFCKEKRAVVVLKGRFRAENEVGQEVKDGEDTVMIEMIKFESGRLIVPIYWWAPMRDIPQES